MQEFSSRISKAILLLTSIFALAACSSTHQMKPSGYFAESEGPIVEEQISQVTTEAMAEGQKDQSEIIGEGEKVIDELLDSQANLEKQLEYEDAAIDKELSAEDVRNAEERANRAEDQANRVKAHMQETIHKSKEISELSAEEIAFFKALYDKNTADKNSYLAMLKENMGQIHDLVSDLNRALKSGQAAMVAEESREKIEQRHQENLKSLQMLQEKSRDMEAYADSRIMEFRKTLASYKSELRAIKKNEKREQKWVQGLNDYIDTIGKRMGILEKEIGKVKKSRVARNGNLQRNLSKKSVTAMKIARDCNMRQRPSANGEILKIVGKDQRLFVSDHNEQWKSVRHGEEKGFMSSICFRKARTLDVAGTR